MDKNSIATGTERPSAVLEKVSAEMAETDILTALLTASEYETNPDCQETIEIRRNNKKLFSFSIHPVSIDTIKHARKLATSYMPNPNNRKLPKVEKDFNANEYQMHLIYMATIPEDQNRIWGNKSFMQQRNCVQPFESVGKILMVGEIVDIANRITEISGSDFMEEEADSPDDYEEYVKN